jgi:hypothetical protein
MMHVAERHGLVFSLTDTRMPLGSVIPHREIADKRGSQNCTKDACFGNRIRAGVKELRHVQGLFFLDSANDFVRIPIPFSSGPHLRSR